MFFISWQFSAKWARFLPTCGPTIFNIWPSRSLCLRSYASSQKRKSMKDLPWKVSWVKPGSGTNHLKGNWKMWSSCVSKKRKERDLINTYTWQALPHLAFKILHTPAYTYLSKFIFQGYLFKPFTFQTWYHYPGVVISQLCCSNNQSQNLSGL